MHLFGLMWFGMGFEWLIVPDEVNSIISLEKSIRKEGEQMPFGGKSRGISKEGR
jgi:hypothetical protein